LSGLVPREKCALVWCCTIRCWPASGNARGNEARHGRSWHPTAGFMTHTSSVVASDNISSRSRLFIPCDHGINLICCNRIDRRPSFRVPWRCGSDASWFCAR